MLIPNPQNLKRTNLKLWSYSQSTLQSIFSLKPTSKLEKNTMEPLVSAKLMCQMELAWVLGHSGVAVNEVADRMSKEKTIVVQLPYPVLPQMEKEIKKVPSQFGPSCYYCCHFCRDDGMPQK